MVVVEGDIATAYRSDYAQRLLKADGEYISFTNYPMFRAIYNGDYRKFMLLTCRQVGKSTTLASFSIIDSITRDHFKTFYISPSQEQTHKFSVDRVSGIIQGSDAVREYFTKTKGSDRVLTREFARTHAKIFFSYANVNADRCRGVTAHRVMFDEIQDIELDNVVPVVQQCYANLPQKYDGFCGTPKTLENYAQQYWEVSSQDEWVIRCDSCGKSTIIESEKALDLHGPICLHCRAYLNPRNGRWVSMNPNGEYKGFHVSRPIMPYDVPAAWPVGPLRDAAQKRWHDIWMLLHGRRPIPLATFRNEVLGVSDSVGARVVTLEHLRAAADGPLCSLRPNPKVNMVGVSKLAVGIDWGGGGIGGKSRTVVVILGWVPSLGKDRVLYYRIFPGLHPVQDLEHIYQVCCFYSGATIIGADEGGGHMPTDLLRGKFGTQRKIVKFKYVVTDRYIKFNKENGLWNLSKVKSLDSLMAALSIHQEIQFPSDLRTPNPLDVPEPFEDILNEYEEWTGPQNETKQWRHASAKPDDFLMALNYARVALMMTKGDLDLRA